MAFVIYAKGSIKVIKMLREIFKKNNIFFLNTKMPECIITMLNPVQYIPKNEMNSIVIQETDDYIQMISNYDTITDEILPQRKLKVGDLVEIKCLPYDNMIGRIREIGKHKCIVEISVWGKIVKDSISFENIRLIQNKENQF